MSGPAYRINNPNLQRITLLQGRRFRENSDLMETQWTMTRIMQEPDYLYA